MSNVEEMSKEELLEIVKKQKEKDIQRKEKMKVYIKNYQQTPSGREKYIKASKKYYDKNRAKILEKKREYYLKKQQEKNK
tara:strand:- start:185 stop:424 length:240 start_codon:yes stop_codon:yes gene_type:complete